MYFCFERVASIGLGIPTLTPVKLYDILKAIFSDIVKEAVEDNYPWGKKRI